MPLSSVPVLHLTLLLHVLIWILHANGTLLLRSISHCAQDQPQPPTRCVELSLHSGVMLFVTGNASMEPLQPHQLHQLSLLKISVTQCKQLVLRILKLNGLNVLLRQPPLIAHQELVNVSGTMEPT